MQQQNNDIKISIATDFSIYPGARYRSDGEKSGQEFYEDLFKPEFEKVKNTNSKLYLDLDGTMGFASSFISEVFTRLVREYKNKTLIISHIEIISNDDPILRDIIYKVIDEADIADTK